MKTITVIAKNTYREIIRDRILYGLVVFALLLMGISMVLGNLSIAEQVRISLNFGLTAIHIGAVVLSIFVGSTLVYKEIDKKTIMTLLVRPISRGEFLIGKALGLCLVNLVIIGGLAMVLSLVLLMLGAEFSPSFFISLYGIFLEGLILMAVALLFSSFSTPFMVVAFTFSVFLVGHWIESLGFFAQKSESQLFIWFEKALTAVWPDFEVVNWRSHAVYQDAIPPMEIVSATGYSVVWFVFLLVGTAMIFRRKDFG